MDKIITASIVFGSVSRMMRSFSSKTRIPLPSDKRLSGEAVIARVNLGRWIGDCECGGAELVDPGEPRFMCFSCGNLVNGGRYRPVEFPKDRVEIERELVKRGGLKRGTFIHPVPGGLPREWIPGESARDLHLQRKAVR